VTLDQAGAPDLSGFGVLWDMDGVLVDTGGFHYQSWQAVLADYGIPLTPARFKETFGMNNADLIAALLGRAPEPSLVEEIGGRKEQLFRELIRGKAHPMPGVLQWLERLQVGGARQAVASSAPCENIDTLVDALAIRSYFQAIISGADMPGKPDPAVFLTAARALDLPPERCLVIEDSVAGVTAARRAGMRCIAVTTTNPPSRLTQADWICDSLEQLSGETLLSLWKGK
jgi:beta-phosphoglucomutase